MLNKYSVEIEKINATISIIGITSISKSIIFSSLPQVAPPYVTRYGGSAVNSAAGGLAAQLVTVADSTKGGGGR